MNMCGQAIFGRLRELNAITNAKVGHHAVPYSDFDHNVYSQYGDTVPYISHWRDENYTTSGPWGFNGIYNARSETLESKWNPSVWQRSVCVLDLFYEGRRHFYNPDTLLIGACIASPKERNMLLVTRNSDRQVLPYHHRMPYLLSEDEVIPYLEGIPISELSSYEPDLVVHSRPGSLART
jgi:hypothetical protein